MFSYLADMLAAPVRTAVIPAASGNLMVARHVIQRLLLRAIGEAAGAGISRVVLVIAPGTEQFFYTPLKEAFEFSIAPRLRLEYSVQPQPEGLGDAVLHAEESIGKDSFAVLLPDELLHQGAKRPDRSGELRSMMSAFDKLPGGNLIAVKSIPKSKMQRSGIARLGEECASRIFRVDELAEKPSSGSLISQSANAFGIVGRYLLRPDIFHALRELKLRGDRPLQLTAALDLIRRCLGPYSAEG
jgi:dTDP-glucose pyrophosphorylase